MVEGLKVVRTVFLACLVAVALGGCQQAPPVAEPKSHRPDEGKPPAAASESECLPTGKQQGKGCDMEGIMAAVRPLRQPGALIPGCYVANVRPPQAGKMLVRFALGPDGRGEGWQWTKDDFANRALQSCLQEALATVEFPAPGDKPCQVVYPFTFIPEVRRGE